MYTNLYEYYLASHTGKVLRTLENWCRYSKINRFIIKYLQRSSSLKYSLIYSFCSKAFQFVDRLWDSLYGLVTASADSSFVITLIRKTLWSTNKLFAYSLLILFFSCSFGVTSILLGTFNNIKAVLLVLGLLTSTLLLVNKSSWIACRKNSLVLRIISYIFD